jgi:hypothetical protein
VLSAYLAAFFDSFAHLLFFRRVNPYGYSSIYLCRRLLFFYLFSPTACITRRKKQSEERASLFSVGVNANVRGLSGVRGEEMRTIHSTLFSPAHKKYHRILKVLLTVVLIPELLSTTPINVWLPLFHIAAFSGTLILLQLFLSGPATPNTPGM